MNSNSSSKKRKKVKGVKINISKYAKDNGISWATAKKRVNGETKRKPRKKAEQTVLTPFQSIVDNKLESYECTAASIYYFIREKGYTGSQSTVTKYVAKKIEELTVKAVLRVETTPGLQGQIDWKESMTLLSRNHEEYTINIFLYVLSYSKYKYIELTIDRTQSTLFRCMVNGFKACGGVPNEIWFDNMKTVVDYHDIDSNEVKFNDTFFEFAKNAMFHPIACKPYRPCTKGIAENVAKIMERLRVFNEEFDTYDDLNNIVKKLNKDINEEICQATNMKPLDKFITEEKEYLTEINFNQFDFIKRPVRKVSIESMIMYDGVKYSVPPELIGQLVEIEVNDNKLHIYYNKKEIVSHDISTNMFNYKAEHLKPILKSTFPHVSDKDIEILCQNRLKGLDFVNRERKKSINEKLIEKTGDQNARNE